MPNLVPVTAADFASYDLSRLVRKEEEERGLFLQPTLERADALVNRYQPITPADRFEAFALLGYHPHGLFVPDDPAGREELRARVRVLGDVEAPDARNIAYIELQFETEQWEQHGVPGHWTGQQAFHRSSARFRLVEFGRRGGKTFGAAREGLGIALYRARSVIWCAGPTMDAVARCFDMIVQLIKDRGIQVLTKRDSEDEKLIILPNGSRIEGVSMQNYTLRAGASVDLAIVDEAAQIEKEAFDRGIRPPLTDKQGQALLISSPEGDGTFMHNRAAEALKEQDPEWAVFIDASYDVNFYVFPQGRQSASIRQEEKDLDPEDFLEQYGAIAAGAKNRIFRQFRDDVHVEPCSYVPGVPVELAVDPSGGAVAYAVEAIQTFDGLSRVFDEYYTAGALAEDAIAWVKNRPWYMDVSWVVMDSASPAEVMRWQMEGFNAFGVPNKPHPGDRYPIYRKLLRDPRTYHPFFLRKRNEILADWGMEPDSWDDLEGQEQKRILLEIEEALSAVKIQDADLTMLRACRRIIFDPRCANVINEHKTYVYRQPRIAGTDLTEQPKKFHDHGLDALGYWSWYHRYDDSPMPLQSTYLKPSGLPQDPKLGPDGEEPHARFMGFLEQMRAIHQPRPDYNYLAQS